MNDNVPDLVRRAEASATRAGFPLHGGAGSGSCCLPDVGRLLGLLAAGCAGGRLGEIGTGAGYGAAWITAAMPPDATLVTIELDHRLAAVATELFDAEPRVTVIQGDAGALIETWAPYDLLFADGAGYGSNADHLAALFPLLRIGGKIVVDDLTPLAALPEDSPFRRSDPKREAFARADGMWSVEVVVPDLRNSAIVGTRLA